MKRGFTLVELLAIIVILAVVVVIASFSVNGVLNSINKNELEHRIESIIDSGILYGQEKPETFNTNCDLAVNGEVPVYCFDITVRELINSGYLTDEENRNPLTRKEMHDDVVMVYRKNNRIYAIIKDFNSCEDENNNDICNLD